MDPVHDRGSMDPDHESEDKTWTGGPWTPDRCFVLTCTNLPTTIQTPVNFRNFTVPHVYLRSPKS